MEEQYGYRRKKKRQLIRFFSIMIEGLAMGIYDFFKDSAYALRRKMGESLLEIKQKKMGFEIEGGEPSVAI